MSSLPLLTTLCPICYKSPPKYRCPRCSIRTCSVECSKTHKTRASCSGIRDPAKYIPKSEMKSSTIDMDFSFLKRVQKAREVPDRLRMPESGKARTSKRRLEHAKRNVAMKKAQARGVDVQRLPQWMERSIQNKTRWDSKTEAVLWTMEWSVTTAEESKTFIEHRIPDSTALREAFPPHGFPTDRIKHFLIRKAVQPASGSTYLRLDQDKTIVENLQGLRIVEFPTVIVVDEIPVHWTIEDVQRSASNQTESSLASATSESISGALSCSATKT